MTSIRVIGLEVSGVHAIQDSREFKLAGPDDKAVDTVVVAGPNGSGKTTFLESILLGLGRGDLIAASGHGDMPPWRSQVPPGGRVVLDLEVLSAPGTVLGAMAPCRVRIERGDSETRAVALTSDGRQSDVSPPLLTQVLEGVLVEYFSSWRNPELRGSVIASTGDREVKGVKGKETGRLFRMKQKIVAERSARGFGGAMQLRDEVWLEAINRFWRSWHRGSDTYIDAQVVDPDAADRQFDLYLCRSGEFGGERVWPLDQASSGELELLSLIGTLITEEFDGILIIDEPELHLHPEWQTLVLESLRTALPGSQIIIGTHSDQVWDRVFSFERVLLLPKGDPREAMMLDTAEGTLSSDRDE